MDFKFFHWRSALQRRCRVRLGRQVIAKGFILNNYTYLRNPWNWLDFIVIFSGKLRVIEKYYYPYQSIILGKMCPPPHTTLFFSIVKNYSFFTKHVKKDTSHLHYIILIWSGLICWVPCTTGYFLIESALKMYRLLHRTKLVLVFTYNNKLKN